MSTPRFRLTIEVPGTSLKRSMKLKTHLHKPEDLADELRMIDWKHIFRDANFDEVAREWTESYQIMLEEMNTHDTRN